MTPLLLAEGGDVVGEWSLRDAGLTHLITDIEAALAGWSVGSRAALVRFLWAAPNRCLWVVWNRFFQLWARACRPPPSRAAETAETALGAAETALRAAETALRAADTALSAAETALTESCRDSPESCRDIASCFRRSVRARDTERHGLRPTQPRAWRLRRSPRRPCGSASRCGACSSGGGGR
jgi:hypothetical protein